MRSSAPSGAPDPRHRLAAPALRAFFALAERWELSTEEQLALLGSPGRTTLFAWRRAAPRSLAPDALARVSYLLASYEALERLFRRAPGEADGWMRRPNSGHPFHGVTPLAFAVEGGIPALMQLRAYLDHAAGGPPSRGEAAPRPAMRVVRERGSGTARGK